MPLFNTQDPHGKRRKMSRQRDPFSTPCDFLLVFHDTAFLKVLQCLCIMSVLLAFFRILSCPCIVLGCLFIYTGPANFLSFQNTDPFKTALEQLVSCKLDLSTTTLFGSLSLHYIQTRNKAEFDQLQSVNQDALQLILSTSRGMWFPIVPLMVLYLNYMIKAALPKAELVLVYVAFPWKQASACWSDFFLRLYIWKSWSF